MRVFTTHVRLRTRNRLSLRFLKRKKNERIEKYIAKKKRESHRYLYLCASLRVLLTVSVPHHPSAVGVPQWRRCFYRRAGISVKSLRRRSWWRSPFLSNDTAIYSSPISLAVLFQGSVSLLGTADNHVHSTELLCALYVDQLTDLSLFPTRRNADFLTFFPQSNAANVHACVLVYLLIYFARRCSLSRRRG